MAVTSSSLQWTVRDGVATCLFQSFISALSYADGLAKSRTAVKVIDTKSNTIYLDPHEATKWLDVYSRIEE